uniref:Putative secreted protein n=1 Tax=Ixodes ricinus TaxID=34613 RepID=A0A6B0U6X6_IXORI
MCLLAFLGAGAFGRAASGHWTCASSDVRSTPGNPCGLHLDASPVLPGTAVGRLRGQALIIPWADGSSRSACVSFALGSSLSLWIRKHRSHSRHFGQ